MVYITGNIPQGNCINVKYLGDNHYECETIMQFSGGSVIFYAKATGNPGEVLHLAVNLPPFDPNDPKTPERFKNHTSFAPAAVETIYTSVDQRNWKRIEDAKLENWQLIFDVPLMAPECYVSINLYYTIPMWEELQRVMGVSPFVERKVISHTLGGEEVVLFKVTDPAVPVSEKEIVYLQGAQHCAEFGGPNVLDGVLRYLADGLDEAGELLKKYEFHVVPIVEPNGWIRGQRGGMGANPNRDWVDFCLPQTKALDEYLRTLPKKPFLLIDMHNGWSSYENDGAWISVMEYLNPSPDYDAQLEFERLMKEECDYLPPDRVRREKLENPSMFSNYAQRNFGFGFTFELARFCIWDRALGKRVPISQARFRRFARQLVHAIDHFAKISLEKGWR